MHSDTVRQKACMCSKVIHGVGCWYLFYVNIGAFMNNKNRVLGPMILYL